MDRYFQEFIPKSWQPGYEALADSFFLASAYQGVWPVLARRLIFPNSVRITAELVRGTGGAEISIQLSPPRVDLNPDLSVGSPVP